MNHWTTPSLKRQYVFNSIKYEYEFYLIFFLLYSGVHASYPLPDFIEVLCSNSLQVDYKKLKNYLQKCPDNFEVRKVYYYKRNV